MKYYTIFAIFLLASLGTAAPVDKGKQRATTPDRPETPPPGPPATPSPPNTPPGPNTPTPGRDPRVPLPGRSGTHVDGRTRVATLRYGDDDMPEHMGHLQRNQAQHPSNRQPMSLAPESSNRNRADALRGIPTAPNHPVTKEPRVRDEKMPNMLHNPKHSSSTTVEYLPKSESNKEGGYTSGFKDAIKNAGPGAQGQLRPNPGWLPLRPDQKRAHEAPAKLNSQTLRPNSGSGAGPSSNKGKGKEKAPAPAAPPAGTSYVPTGRPGLRERVGVPPPPPTGPKKEKSTTSAPSGGQTNLQPGRVAPPGHVWKPSTSGPSHAGAPPHPSGSEQRQPPRPQDRDHYLRQKEQKAAEEKKKQAASQGRPPSPPPPSSPKHAANLAKFESQFGPAKKGNGAGGSNEAPARIQTPHNPPSRPSTPHSGPSTPNSRPPTPNSRPPTPNSKPPTPPPHGSSSKKQPPKKG